jgi:hypothetical protein
MDLDWDDGDFVEIQDGFVLGVTRYAWEDGNSGATARQGRHDLPLKGPRTRVAVSVPQRRGGA